MNQWFYASVGSHSSDVIFFIRAALTVVLEERCSGSYIVARALLDCVVSSLEYSGSICGERQQSKGRAQKRLGIKGCCIHRENDRKSVLPCTYLGDEELRKHPDQK